MRIEMKYGKAGLTLDLPHDLVPEVIRKKAMPILPDPQAALRSALSHPLGARPLALEAGGCRSACILICDITRPVPNGIILPILVTELLAAGMKPEEITILVATGLHRPNEGAELRELVNSDWVLDTVRVVNHFARAASDHESLGILPGGIPVRLDRRFVRSDLKIVVGLVEPHFMAGYSGGRKIITPGIAHEDTIRMLHASAVLENCLATNCILEGNPLHEHQMKVLEMVGKCLAVSTVIDENRRISHLNFGGIDESHRDAVSFVRSYGEIPVRRRFRTVVTSAAGYPLDKTYYQTVKGMVGALDILEQGGDLIIVSECAEGIGSQEFADAQRELIRRGPEPFLQMLLSKPAAAIDEWQSEMLVRALKRGTIHLFSSGLTEDQFALTGVRQTSSPGEAILASVVRHADRTLAVIPEGPYVIPVYTPEVI